MQTREMIAKLKKVGLTTSRHLTAGFALASVATNLYILLWPLQAETETCENALNELGDHPSFGARLDAVMIKDKGLYIFNMVLLSRALALPLTDWAYSNVAALSERVPTMSEYRRKSLQIWENDLMFAIGAGLFLNMLPISKAVTLPASILTLSPIVQAFLKHHLINYPGMASYQEYLDANPARPGLAKVLAAISAVSVGLAAAGTASGLTANLINGLYDASHATDWVYQDGVNIGSAALGMVGGMTASIFSPLMHTLGNSVMSVANNSLLLSMVLSSEIFCFFEQLIENPDTYFSGGLYVWLGILTTSLSLMVMHERFVSNMDEKNKSDVMVEEVDSDEKSKEDYIIPSEPNNSTIGYGTFFKVPHNQSEGSSGWLADSTDSILSSSDSDTAVSSSSVSPSLLNLQEKV